MSVPGNPYEAWIKESARISQKLLKGYENMAQVKDLESGGVFKVPVHHVGRTRKNRAVLARLIAKGDDEIEFLDVQFGDVFGAQAAGVHAEFPERAQGEEVDSGGLGAGAAYSDVFWDNLPGKGLGHLAPAGVLGADKKDAALTHDIFLQEAI